MALHALVAARLLVARARCGEMVENERKAVILRWLCAWLLQHGYGPAITQDRAFPTIRINPGVKMLDFVWRGDDGRTFRLNVDLEDLTAKVTSDFSTVLGVDEDTQNA